MFAAEWLELSLGDPNSGRSVLAGSAVAVESGGNLPISSEGSKC